MVLELSYKNQRRGGGSPDIVKLIKMLGVETRGLTHGKVCYSKGLILCSLNMQKIFKKESISFKLIGTEQFIQMVHI